LHVAVDNVSDNGQFEAVAADPDHGSVSSAIVDENNPNSDDTVYVKISVDTDSATEGGELTYTLTLVDSDGNSVTPPAGTLVSGDLNWSGAAAGGADTSALPNSFTIGDSGSFEFKVAAVDDPFNEGSEALNVTVENVSDNGKFEVIAVDPANKTANSQIVDEDGSNQNNPRDAIAVKLTGPDSVMEGEETAPFTITLSDPANSGAQSPLATPGSIVTLSYTYINADGNDITEILEAVIGLDGLTATFSVPTTQDDVYEAGQAFTVSVVSIKDGNGPDAKDLFEALDVTNAHQTVAIDDSKDNPPEAEDFTVELASNGGAAIVFNSDTPANDHISDEEDDASNTPVEVVITQLPTSGVLLYDGVEITPEQLTKFNSDGSVDGVLTTFDASKITYQNDNQSTGFILGVKESPDEMQGDESTESFLNWGEPVDGKPNQRELTFEGSNDVITITANSANDQPLAQYYA
ncbi:RTX toxin, partial [Vibrio sinensis]